MSPDGFTVDLDALGVARDQVGRLADELIGPPRDIPSAQEFGHDHLKEAVDDFDAREKRSMAQLAAEAISIRHRLADTIKTYRDADENSARQFGDIAL